MAAGFTLKRSNLSDFRNFIIKDFSRNALHQRNIFKYDAEISPKAFNKDFYKDIQQLEPFGTGNPSPTFLIKNLKVIKVSIIQNEHMSAILKSNLGIMIKSISFNSVNKKIGKYLLNYKKTFSVLGQINENDWNNKKALQLTILDLII